MISCLMVSHEKPDLSSQAIESVLTQTTTDWELLIMDSGTLFHDGYFKKFTDSRIKVYQSGETADLREQKSMAPWCFNEFIRRKLPSGELITYLCDDDIYYPEAFSIFGQWASNNPKMNAMYASIDLAVALPNQEPMIYGQRKALEIGGRGAYPMDCRVDYLQLCHRLSVLEHFENEEYWPEGKEHEKHADGVFMERLGQICHIYPIPVKIGQNRRTPSSTYYPVK